MLTRFARAVSIAAHPAILLPLAAFVALHDRLSPARLAASLAAIIALALVVMVWSAWQVRRGRWAHVDASDRGERRSLNRFLLAILVGGTALTFALHLRAAAIGLAGGALIMAAAQASVGRLKLSQHVAFATYAALAAATASVAAALAIGALVLLLAWSRLHLRRHTPAEVIAGAAAGGGAGLLLLATAAWIGA